MLDVAGATMTEAESGEIGLKLIDERDFDMALVDLRMPGMDGITAIRADPRARRRQGEAADHRRHRRHRARPARTLPGGGRRRSAVQAGGDGRAVRGDGPHPRGRRGGRDPLNAADRRWRPDRESNPGARICSPLRHHSAIGPRCGKARGIAQAPCPSQPPRADPRQFRPVAAWRERGPHHIGRARHEVCCIRKTVMRMSGP